MLTWKHLVKSFQTHKGRRGVHFFDSKLCNFMYWNEVIQFLKTLPVEASSDTFADKLTETLANYDPEREFLAVQQNGESVSVELYTQPPDWG